MVELPWHVCEKEINQLLLPRHKYNRQKCCCNSQKIRLFLLATAKMGVWNEKKGAKAHCKECRGKFEEALTWEDKKYRKDRKRVDNKTWSTIVGTKRFMRRIVKEH